MTLRITEIHSATYGPNGNIKFTVDCGPITNVVTGIQAGEKNTINNAKLNAWLEDNTPSPYVEPVIPQEDLEYNAKIVEREELKSMTAIELLALSEEERGKKVTRFNELKTL